MGAYVLGVSGASGAPLTLRVLEGMLAGGHRVYGVISDAARRVLELESGVLLNGDTDHDTETLLAAVGYGELPGQLTLFGMQDYASAISSGSFYTDGMAIVPCSMGTLGRIAAGTSSSVLERSADIALKERRPLVLVPRDTPLNLIHLRNLVTVAEAGAIVLPPMPAFYTNPQSVQDVVDAIAGRVLDQFGIEASFMKRWSGPPGEEVDQTSGKGN
jgi:4-hydroxy-3-polyprenylbenzoate decarboxylase